MKRAMAIFLTFSMAFLLLFSMTACDTVDEGNSGDDEFKKAYDGALENFVEEDYDASITYKTLETDSDSYTKKLLKYTGKITKTERTSDNKADVYHVSVENDSNKTIWAQTSASGKSDVDDVAVGDTVQVYGMMYGMNLFTPILYVVKLVKTDEIKGTRTNPYKLGETATYNGMDSYMSYFQFIAEVTPTAVIRGDEATNMFSNNPDEGKEFFLVKFKVKVIESKDDEKVKLNNARFDIVNKDGVTYGAVVSATGIKEFDEIYPGAETEGFVYQIIDAGDEPSVVFYDIWFSFSE